MLEVILVGNMKSIKGESLGSPKEGTTKTKPPQYEEQKSQEKGCSMELTCYRDGRVTGILLEGPGGARLT